MCSSRVNNVDSIERSFNAVDNIGVNDSSLDCVMGRYEALNNG